MNKVRVSPTAHSRKLAVGFDALINPPGKDDYRVLLELHEAGPFSPFDLFVMARSLIELAFDLSAGPGIKPDTDVWVLGYWDKSILHNEVPWGLCRVDERGEWYVWVNQAEMNYYAPKVWFPLPESRFGIDGDRRSGWQGSIKVRTIIFEEKRIKLALRVYKSIDGEVTFGFVADADCWYDGHKLDEIASEIRSVAVEFGADENAPFGPTEETFGENASFFLGFSWGIRVDAALDKRLARLVVNEDRLFNLRELCCITDDLHAIAEWLDSGGAQ